MRAPILTFYCFLVCAVALGEDPQDHLLKNHFVGKTFFIRNYYLGPALEYDETGVVKNHPYKGDWTTAKFLVERTKSSRFSFELSGKRLALGYDNKKESVMFYIIGDLSMRFNIFQGPITQSTLDHMNNYIFIDLQKEPERVPDYWRDLVSGNVLSETEKTGKKRYRLKDIPSRRPDAPEDTEQIVSSTPQGPLYLVGGMVKPPKPVKTPDPEYSVAARKLRYEGTSVIGVIVNEQGRVENPRIVKPLGFGLDESAVQAVKKWTFKPATRDGKGVRVFLYVEFSYRLW